MTPASRTDLMSTQPSADRSTDPDTMTPKSRKSEIAKILALGLVRSSSLLKEPKYEVSDSSPEELEEPEDADLSVAGLGPIGGPKPKPKPSKGGSRDRNDRSRDR
tara:strand:+ start:336 stop:650 length:315 start_codon:yes stop_codon:yes gene_type:complete